MTAMPDLVFNGVHAATGASLLPALTVEQLARLAVGERWDPFHLAELKNWNEHVQENYLETHYGVDPQDLAQAGWGVVFAHDCSPAVRTALEPLLAWRRAQASQHDERLYRELIYRPGESKLRFLARHGVGPGPVDPIKLPYYLLLVGGPEEIPFSFQYQLDVQYAVGRLAFATPAEYAVYAESVIAAERGHLERARQVAFFGVANPDDPATLSSCEQLVAPLAAQLANSHGWTAERILATDATKASLLATLSRETQAPALVFSAGHGLGFEPTDARQLTQQGALVCQDWPGPQKWRGPIPEDHYLAAHDIPESAACAGLIAFFFACYGAGSPQVDQFVFQGKTRRQIASHDFVARLPQRLLGHPRGSALAVVGHVDRAWSYSFTWPRAEEQLAVFASAFGRLLAGAPIGYAMETFNERYAELATDLSFEREEVDYGRHPDFLTLSGLWTANNDARSYVVLGDPAVRLAVSSITPCTAPQG